MASSKQSLLLLWVFFCLFASISANPISEWSELPDCARGCVEYMALSSGAKCTLEKPQCYCSLQKFLDNMDSCIHDGEGRGCKKKLGSSEKTDAYLYIENVFCPTLNGTLKVSSASFVQAFATSDSEDSNSSSSIRIKTLSAESTVTSNPESSSSSTASSEPSSSSNDNEYSTSTFFSTSTSDSAFTSSSFDTTSPAPTSISTTTNSSSATSAPSSSYSMSITTTVEVVTLNTTGTATKTTADGFVQDTNTPNPLRPSADAAAAKIDTSLVEAGIKGVGSMLALVVMLGAGVVVVH